MNKAKKGELALQLVGDYPLYASTSGITYDEAIAIALVLYPDEKEWADIVKEM